MSGIITIIILSLHLLHPLYATFSIFQSFVTVQISVLFENKVYSLINANISWLYLVLQLFMKSLKGIKKSKLSHFLGIPQKTHYVSSVISSLDTQYILHMLYNMK